MPFQNFITYQDIEKFVKSPTANAASYSEELLAVLEKESAENIKWSLCFLV